MTDLHPVLDVAIAALLIVGAAFSLIGSYGLAKLNHILKRLHGPSKATTLGVGCVLAASAIAFALTGRPSLHEVLIAVFLFATAPVSAHLIVKAAIRLDPSLRPPAPGEPGGVRDAPAPRSDAR